MTALIIKVCISLLNARNKIMYIKNNNKPTQAHIGICIKRGTEWVQNRKIMHRQCFYRKTNTIIEKTREFNLETHMAFLDLEKAFDAVNREKIWEILNRKRIPYHLISVI